MSLLVLKIDGQPFVQVVQLDDPSPGYAASYAHKVREYIDPDATLRWAEVDVTSVAEYGPNDIANMLSESMQDAGLLTDLPQRLETL